MPDNEREPRFALSDKRKGGRPTRLLCAWADEYNEYRALCWQGIALDVFPVRASLRAAAGGKAISWAMCSKLCRLPVHPEMTCGRSEFTYNLTHRHLLPLDEKEMASREQCEAYRGTAPHVSLPWDYTVFAGKNVALVLAVTR